MMVNMGSILPVVLLEYADEMGPLLLELPPELVFRLDDVLDVAVACAEVCVFVRGIEVVLVSFLVVDSGGRPGVGAGL